MAEVVAVLSYSWKLINAIQVITNKIEETREQGRAFKFLCHKASSFVDAVHNGLAASNSSPYETTIPRLERLLEDILRESNEYSRMKRASQMFNTSQTKQTLLHFNRELELFRDTFLMQTAAHTVRLNIEALSRPIPAANHRPVIPDDIQWEIMSQKAPTSTNASPSSRVSQWRQGVFPSTSNDGRNDDSRSNTNRDSVYVSQPAGNEIETESGPSVSVAPLSIETSLGRFVPENGSSSPLSPTSSATSALPKRPGMFKRVAGLIKSSKAPLLPVDEPMPFLYIGIVKDAGTFEHLVARLVSDSGNIRTDEEYRDIFLTTYTAFSSGDTLFNRLQHLFNEAPMHPHPSPEHQHQTGRRYNIIMIFQRWASSTHVRIDEQVLVRMKEFAIPIRDGGVEPMEKRAKELIRIVEKRHQESHTASHLRDTPVVPVPVSIKAHDISIALSALEQETYKSVLPADYITHLVRPSTPNNVKAAMDVHKKITNWIKRSILLPEFPESRGKALKLFIDTANECCLLGNFATLSVIGSTLHSDGIRLLCLTVQELDSGTKSNYDKIGKLCNTANNYKAYRKELNTYRKKLKALAAPCIPWPDVHLQDLSHVLDKYPSEIMVDGEGVINFARWIKFTAQWREIPQTADINYEPDTAMVSYVLRSLEERTDVDLEKRSTDLRAIEEKLNRERVPQLRDVGFAANYHP